MQYKKNHCLDILLTFAFASHPSPSDSILEFPEYLCESLEVLHLNDNQLDAVPMSVCFLKGLSELYLGKYVQGTLQVCIATRNVDGGVETLVTSFPNVQLRTNFHVFHL